MCELLQSIFLRRQDEVFLVHGANLNALLHSAGTGDAGALAALTRMGKHLGLAIGNALELFNPELVILGGKLIVARDYFLPAMQQELALLPARPVNRNVVVSALAGPAIAMGACALILESAFARIQEPGPVPKSS